MNWLKRFFSKDKRAVSLSSAKDYAVVLGLVAIVGAVVALILSAIQSSSSITADSLAYNITGFGLDALNNFYSLWPIAGTILVAGIIISIIVVLVMKARS